MEFADRALAQPFELGGVTLRNRVVLPAHTTNFGERNVPTRRNADYLAARAAGGVGLVITEAIRVHPSSAGRHQSLGSFDDSSIPAFTRLASAVQAEGGAIFAQLMHIGRQAAGDATRTAAWGASAIPWARGAVPPHVMSAADLKVLVDAFAAAAVRMRTAGFDGIEIHAGHGHLIQQFLSPATNRRHDEYGGSAENRTRLLRQVLDAVFEAVPGMPVGLRISVDEFIPGGLGPSDTVELLAPVVPQYPLAYLHASHSAYQSGYALSTQMADMHFPATPFVENAALVKAAFPDVPVIAVCRFDTLANAADAVDAGVADLVALARPQIAEPALVNKTLAGELDTVTSCLACNQACIGRVEMNLPITCVVNPEVGEERIWAEIETMPRAEGRRVLVVGGGPAGMKAALAAHGSGARVTLAEATDHLGGQVVLAATVGGRDRLGLSVEELARDLLRSEVEVLLSTRVDAEFVRAGAYAEVVVATGSRPVRRDLPIGVTLLDVHEALRAIEGGTFPATGTVLVVDGEGTWASASLAEHLGGQGRRVELLSPVATLFNRITTYTKANLLDRLAGLPVGLHLISDVESGTGSQIVVRNQVTGDLTTFDDVGVVIDVAPPRAADELYQELARTEGVTSRVVGDANSPRTVLEAVYEGHRAGKECVIDPAAINRALAVVH